MKRYGNIFSKIYDMENLKLAHACARKDKLYYREVKMVDQNPEMYLRRIQVLLQNKTYRITEKDYSVSTLNDKGKVRELWKLPYYPHRIVQWAIMLQIENVFMEVFCSHTCASLKNRGIRHAYELTRRYISDAENSKYCLKLDIRKFYPNINHAILKSLLRKKFKDKDLLELLDMLIDSYPTEKGVPIGSYLSQYLANFYLAYFDHWVKEKAGAKRVVRYMDDLIILDGSKEYLHKLRRKIDEYLQSELKVCLKDDWQVFPVKERGISFIGYRFFPEYILLRKQILKRLKRRIKIIEEKQYFAECLSFKEWCSANSYVGWLTWCNSYNLFTKYVEPIIPALLLYYGNEILVISEKLTVWAWLKRFKDYTAKLYQKRGLKH